MEVFKLGKIIENQVIDVHLTLHKVEEAREELRKSLKIRKEIAIAENEIHYRRSTPHKFLPKETPKSLMQQ